MDIFFDIAHEQYLRRNECGFSGGQIMICDRCKQENYDFNRIDGQNLCDECKDEVLRERAYEYTDEFLDKYPEDKLDFYVNSLGSFLSDGEKETLKTTVIEVIRIMFESKYHLSDGLKNFVETLKLNYCLDSDGFLEFVESKLQ